MRREARERQRIAAVHHHEALETFRALVSLERQSWSVFAATDVLLVAYGLYIKVANEKELGGVAPIGSTYAATRTPELVQAYSYVQEAPAEQRAELLRKVDSGSIGARAVATIAILIGAQVVLVIMTLLSGYKLF